MRRRDFILGASGLLLPARFARSRPARGITAPPAGARALGYSNLAYNFNPTFTDVSFTNVPTTKLYSGTYSQTPPDSTHYLNQPGPLTMQLGSDGQVGHCAAQRLNSTQGALPYLASTPGFYFQATVKLSDWNADHWLAVWALPKEHDNALDATLSIPPAPAGSVNYEGFVELDGSESLGSYEQSSNNAIDWHGTFSNLASVASASQTVANPGVFTTASQSYPSGTMLAITGTAPGGFALQTPYFVSATGLTSTTCQLSATRGGASIQCTASHACTLNPGYININHSSLNTKPAVDWTVPHRIGTSYNSTSKLATYWTDDVQWFQVDLSAFSYEIDPYHYYQIVSCQTLGANTQYQMTVYNMQAWTP